LQAVSVPIILQAQAILIEVVSHCLQEVSVSILL